MHVLMFSMLLFSVAFAALVVKKIGLIASIVLVILIKLLDCYRTDVKEQLIALKSDIVNCVLKIRDKIWHKQV
jgi:hypothetical protein